MPTLNLKRTHKSVKSYYAALDQFARLDVTHETAVRAAFQGLLAHCARQCRWTLVPEFGVSTGRGRRIVVDGALVDDFRLTHGCWEAKGHPRRSAGGGGAQVCGGLPARQYPVSDAAAGDAVAERAAGAGRGFDGRGAVDRDAADVLRLPAAGVCGVGGGRRPVQGQGRGHRAGPGPADPAGAEKQPHLHRRVRRIFGQMPPVDQPEPGRGRGRGDADPAPADRAPFPHGVQPPGLHPPQRNRLRDRECDRRAYLPLLQPRRIF